MNKKDKAIFILILSVIGLLIALSFIVTWQVASIGQNRFISIEDTQKFHAAEIAEIKQDVVENKKAIIEQLPEKTDLNYSKKIDEDNSKTIKSNPLPAPNNKIQETSENKDVREIEIAEQKETGVIMHRYKGDDFWRIIPSCEKPSLICLDKE